MPDETTEQVIEPTVEETKETTTEDLDNSCLPAVL